MKLLVVALIGSSILSSAQAVTYNPATANANREIIKLEKQTLWCMRNGSRAKLDAGDRSRDDITLFTITACGAPLRTLLMQNGRTNDQAVTRLIELADRQLDAVMALGQ